MMSVQTTGAAPRGGRRYQLESGLGLLTPAERAERGKQARAAVPRDTHAVFDPPPDRPDPIGLLEEQAKARVPELVPVRWGRMMVSPFTYYRGAALPMATDLAATPVSGLAVQACGDAHLSNFGIFGSPERRLVFDVNDFDETLPGPWEWDVKRLAASMEVAVRGNGQKAMTAGPPESLVTEGVRSLEVRWIFPGQLEAAVARWFGRFPAAEESREDTYLLDPQLRGLSVKVRGGGALEVKAYRGSPGILEVPGRARGRMESWQKWSFPFSPLSQDSADKADLLRVAGRIGRSQDQLAACGPVRRGGAGRAGRADAEPLGDAVTAVREVLGRLVHDAQDIGQPLALETGPAGQPLARLVRAAARRCRS